nr:hypothetical protein [Pectobacterium brasiliense]
MLSATSDRAGNYDLSNLTSNTYYRPSWTETWRPGITTKLKWDLSDEHSWISATGSSVPASVKRSRSFRFRATATPLTFPVTRRRGSYHRCERESGSRP